MLVVARFMKVAGKILAVALEVFAVQLPGALTFAQEQPSLNAVLADPRERSVVLDAARRSTVVVNNPCASANFDLTDVVVVYRPVTVDASGIINGGAWKQVVRERGCGSSRTLNVLAYVQQPRSLATAPLLPGTTRADPQLQKDGARYAGTAAGLPEKTVALGISLTPNFCDGRRPGWAAARVPRGRSYGRWSHAPRRRRFPCTSCRKARGPRLARGR